MKIYVSVDGCDDSTDIEIDATPEELAFLERVAGAIKDKSHYGCMPRMNVWPSSTVPSYIKDEATSEEEV